MLDYLLEKFIIKKIDLEDANEDQIELLVKIIELKKAQDRNSIRKRCKWKKLLKVHTNILNVKKNFVIVCMRKYFHFHQL